MKFVRYEFCLGKLTKHIIFRIFRTNPGDFTFFVRLFSLDACREKNAELEKAAAMQRQKEEKAENTLAEFKRKMEETSKKMFDDTKTQV